MRRRAFSGAFSRLLGGVMAASTAWPSLLSAQQKAMPVIGWLSGSALVPTTTPNGAAFRQGLGEAGYVEGQNVAFENRWADGHFNRLPALAADLVGRKVDVIVAVADSAAHAAKNATSTIPIVFIGGDDPVAAGLGDSLARPGGNITGITVLTGALNPKRLDLLREIAPQADAIALLVNPDNQATGRVIRDMQEATRPGGLRFHILKAGSASEIDAAFASLAQQQASALVVDADVFFFGQREQIVTLAARHAVPAIYGARDFVAAGGLVSYGTIISAAFHQVGLYAGRILKGAKPVDLPVMQPTVFEMVINLKTAAALGLTIPPPLLAGADEVIE